MRLKDTVLRNEPNLRFAFVLYGLTKIDECARDPEGTSRINVDSLKVAIDDLVDAGIKPVFASTDAVFDGSRGLWKEDDFTKPILTYAKQKVAVERHIESKPAPWVIARLPKLVSRVPGSNGLFDEWSDYLEAGKPVRCATDWIFSPADVLDVADGLISLAEGPFSGVFNLGGPEVMSRMGLFKLFLATASRRKTFDARVEACRMSDFGFIESRPLDVSMNPARVYSALGHSFSRMEEICEEFVRHRFGSRDERPRMVSR